MKILKALKSFVRFLLRETGGRRIEANIRYHLILKRNFANIKFQGQYLQDMIVYLFFKKKKTGFYIDIGVNDGISGSNTYVFEQLGWDGICIEPQPEVFNKLTKYRKCNSFNVALSSKSSDNAEFFTICGADALGSLNSVRESHKNWAKSYGQIKYIKVKTRTFDEILNNYPEIKYIDYMSIDAEGHEMISLNTINFKKYSFGLISIEKGDENIITFMKDNGYDVFMELEGDILYIQKNK